MQVKRNNDSGFSRFGSRFKSGLLLALVMLCISTESVEAAFGVSHSGGIYTVDNGAGLSFEVQDSDGDVQSLVYNGVEYQDTGYAWSQIIFGLGSPTTVSATNMANQYVVVTIQTGSTNTTVANLTHYLVVKNGENTVYMATYAENKPGIGELRWITRLDSSKLPNGSVPGDRRGSSGTIESSDVFGMPDGTTRSKYYGDDLTHGKDRAMDMTYCGATGDGVGVWMVYGNRESSSGGPFFRDIQSELGGQHNLTDYLFSGHNQTESMRLNVLHGPYALVFNDGTEPSLLMDFSWMGALGLLGWVPDSGRGVVTGTVSGIRDGYENVVGFSNTSAQYWAVADGSGNYTSPRMKPGTYEVTLYKQELEVATSSVTVAAGGTNTLNLASAEPNPGFLWKIGEWDGTPAGFLNADKVIEMHPSDVRMADWDAAPSGSPFVVGTSDPRTKVPCYQWQDEGDLYIQFELTASQAATYSYLRVGITAAYAGGRPHVVLNGYDNYPGPSSQPDSRSLTIGTYRGNNKQWTYTIGNNLKAGVNTLRIDPISGSGTSGFLSAGYSIDCIELDGPAPASVPSAPATVDAAWKDGQVTLNWQAELSATHYILERATSSNGTYTVLSSNLEPARYTDTSVDTNLTYFYRVAAGNSVGTSSKSTPASAVPDRPTGLSAAAVSTSRIDLSWTATVGADSYNIKRATLSGGPYTTITNVAGLGYADSGLSANTTYYYVVSAVNSAGEGQDSPETYALTWPPSGMVGVANAVNGTTVAGAVADASGVLLATDPFDMSGGNAVALLLTAEGLADDANLAGFGATFAGQSMTAVTATDTGAGAQSATIFYLINPSVTDGSFEVTAGAGVTADLAYSRISLFNVSAVAGTDAVGSTSTANTTPMDVNYTTTTDAGFVLGAAANNDYNNTRQLSVAYGNPDTDLLSHTMIGSSGHFHTYGDVLLAGSCTDGYYGQYDRTAIATVAFDAVTIPSIPPHIDVSRTNGMFLFNWPSNYLGYRLMHRTNLLEGTWVEIPNSEINNSYMADPALLPADNNFYRLVYP